MLSKQTHLELQTSLGSKILAHDWLLSLFSKNQLKTSALDPNHKYTHYKKVDEQLLIGIGIENFSTCPFKQNSWRDSERIETAGPADSKYLSSSLNMSDSVLNKYLAPSNGDEDFEYNDDVEHMPSPPRTTNPYHPMDDTMDPSIESENESPPASQLEPRHKTASYAKDTFKDNERQSPPKSPVRDYLTTELVLFLHAQMHCVYGPNF